MIGRNRTAFHKHLRENRASRRAVLGAGLSVLACAGAATAQAAPVVTLFGDSIVAGYGLSPADGLAHQLELALTALGVTAQVRNAGVPGDTTFGGLGRLDASVRKDTAVCVVEFGGNDRRQGFPLSATRDNLAVMLDELKARGVAAVLVGLGAGEAAQMYRALAEAKAVAIYPSLYAGVDATMRLPDGLHPNAAGEKVIAAGLAPMVADALAARRRSA